MLETLTIDPGAEGDLWLYEAAGLVHPAHTHAELELDLVTAGTAHYWLEGRLYQLEADAVVWLYPGQQHRLVVESATSGRGPRSSLAEPADRPAGRG